MIGNERNDAIGNGQLKRVSSNLSNQCKFNVSNELDQYLNIDVKKRSNSEDSTQVVKFEGIEDKDSICSEVKEKNLPPIPDGGWGWVVVIAAFLTSACSDGLAYSFGILHEEFINYFGESQAKTSWIGSLFIAVPLLSGPIMSALVERYGCRKMTMIASLVSTGGFLLASISNSVELLYLTLGIISGLAMGILYVTSVVAVAFWFDKRRTLAVSLASCGIGFGTVMYSPLTTFLLQMYDWRNTIILLSGTILNMCVCGALMRDPDWVIIKDKRAKKNKQIKKAAKLRKSSSLGSLSIKSMGGESVVLSINELNDLVKSGQSPEYILSVLTSAVAESEELEAITQMNAELGHKRNNSTVDLPTFIHQNEQVPDEVIENIMSNKTLSNIIQQNYPHLINRRSSEVKFTVGDLCNRNSKDSGLYPESIGTTNHSNDGITIIIPIQEKEHEFRDIKNNLAVNKENNMTDSAYSKDMSVYGNPVVHRRALTNMPYLRPRASSLPDIYKSCTSSVYSKSGNEKKWYDPIMKMLRNNFDFKMFTEFHFLMFNITSILMSIWSIIPFFFLKSYMSDVEMDGAALMVSIIGISSGIGIVVLGWFGDKPWYNVTKAYAICLMVCGVSVATYPFVITDYALLIVVSIVFGVSFASSYSYTPAILMELVPIDKFTMGYGMVLLSQGIGNLIGPPIGGLLFDVSGNWDLTFFMGGGWLVISGLCVGTIAYLKNVRICGNSPLLLDAAKQNSQTGPDNV